MHREYNDKISCMKECIQKKNKLTGILKQTEQDLIQEKLRLNQLLNEYEKENQDVFDLEAINITSLFYTILGNKEKQLEKGTQDVLKAKLKYDQCKHNVEYLVDESKKLVDELSKIDCCEKEYEELIDEKLKILSSDDSEISEKIKKLIKRKENIYANIKEVDEAIEVGEESLKAVEMTIRFLEKADNWGVWDLSGERIAEASVKHSYIDEAREHAVEAQRLLGKFKREISDINMITNSVICVGSFETFSDYFFDGLIYDWIVQSEIGKSLDTVKNTKNQIDRAMSKLYEEKVTEEFMLNQLEEQIKRIVSIHKNS